MKTLLKSLIVWLMLLAIPFQGFASATMLVCAPMHSVPQIAAMAKASAIQRDHHATSSAAVTGEHGHHAASTKAHASQAETDDRSSAHHDAGSKCHACATCCFGASMTPSYAARIAAEAQHVALISFEVDRVASVDLAHPERPPQTSLT